MSTKYCNPAVLDAALDEVTQASEQHACSQMPASFAEVATYSLASVSLSLGDYSKSDGVVSGRRLTIAEKLGVQVAAEGTATHVALVDTTTNTLLYVTTSDPQGLTLGSFVDFPAWSIEIEDPS